MAVEIKQFDFYWVSLDPTLGSEIKKTGPCVVISPNGMNRHLRTIIVAPLSSTIKELPFRIQCTISGKKGSILLDQLRTVDKVRLKKKMGSLSKHPSENILEVLQEMFAPA
jgi:mRNA interferase MazF